MQDKLQKFLISFFFLMYLKIRTDTLTNLQANVISMFEFFRSGQINLLVNIHKTVTKTMFLTL